MMKNYHSPPASLSRTGAGKTTLSLQASVFNRKSKIKNQKFTFCSLLLALCCGSGCTVLTYTSPSGERFTRSSLGSKTTVSALTIESDTNGLRRVELRGYRSDSAQVMGTLMEAAVRAAIEAAK